MTGRRAGGDTSRVLDGLDLHLSEFGLGSVSETMDADAPHTATGCPFQAWSVAELIRSQATQPHADAQPLPLPPT